MEHGTDTETRLVPVESLLSDLESFMEKKCQQGRLRAYCETDLTVSWRAGSQCSVCEGKKAPNGWNPCPEGPDANQMLHGVSPGEVLYVLTKKRLWKLYLLQRANWQVESDRRFDVNRWGYDGNPISVGSPGRKLANGSKFHFLQFGG